MPSKRGKQATDRFRPAFCIDYVMRYKELTLAPMILVKQDVSFAIDI